MLFLSVLISAANFVPVIENNKYMTENGTVLTRNYNMTCKTMDLIYLLICMSCKGEYCGETGIQINERINLHRNQISNDKYRKMAVCKHVNECGNNKFYIFPFHKCFKQDHVYRETLELFYREQIQPRLH